MVEMGVNLVFARRRRDRRERRPFGVVVVVGLYAIGSGFQARTSKFVEKTD